MITRERPVKREIIEKKIKGIFLKKTKIKIKNRIKNNLINLVEKKSSTLIIFLPDFAKRANTINI